MKFEHFIAGTLEQRYQYKSFEPSKINCEWGWDDPTVNTLLASANRALGELNAFSLIVPDIDLFITMHIVKEAQKSSKIEGIQTEMEEAVLSEEQILPEKRDDWKEVQNYIAAITDAIDELDSLPLSCRLLKHTHSTLMRGVRGEHKSPGEFRQSQNWIGGSSLVDAAFIPPHADNVSNLMADLESFWHNEEIHVPHLIRIAISHYQFETIHPFLDGNGRIGRLLVPLYLINHGVLNKPSLYLSDFFEKNRANYYDALTRVRTSNDLIHWIKFFLNGLVETAEHGKNVFQSILSIRQDAEKKIMTLGQRAELARTALDILYKQPIISVAILAKRLNIAIPTATRLIKSLVDLEILVEFTGRQRGKMYEFEKYFNLFD